MRRFAQFVAFRLVLTSIAAACTSPSTTPSPTVAASSSASTRPHFDLATYQYSLQTKGKIRIGTQEDNPPFSVKNPATGKWDGFDVAYGRAIASAIVGDTDDPYKNIDDVAVTSWSHVRS